jgi:DNA-binding transcriptional regulator PaaX
MQDGLTNQLRAERNWYEAEAKRLEAENQLLQARVEQLEAVHAMQVRTRLEAKKVRSIVSCTGMNPAEAYERLQAVRERGEATAAGA